MLKRILEFCKRQIWPSSDIPAKIELPFYTVWADGSFHNQYRNYGGYAALVFENEKGSGEPFYSKLICGGMLDPHDSQSVEITPIVKTLEHLKNRSHVLVYTDCQHVVRFVELLQKDKAFYPMWATGKLEGFRANRNLLKRLKKQVDFHQVELRWCKSHTGRTHNNEGVDELAREMAHMQMRNKKHTLFSVNDYAKGV